MDFRLIPQLKTFALLLPLLTTVLLPRFSVLMKKLRLVLSC